MGEDVYALEKVAPSAASRAMLGRSRDSWAFMLGGTSGACSGQWKGKSSGWIMRKLGATESDGEGEGDEGEAEAEGGGEAEGGDEVAGGEGGGGETGARKPGRS